MTRDPGSAARRRRARWSAARWYCTGHSIATPGSCGEMRPSAVTAVASVKTSDAAQAERGAQPGRDGVGRAAGAGAGLLDIDVG